MPPHLTFDLIFPPLPADLDGVTVHVHIEDTGEADAPARPIFQQAFPNVRVSRDAGRATLRMELPDLGGAVAPALRVHVDTTGGGAIRPGDFVNPSIAYISQDGRQPERIDLVQVR